MRCCAAGAREASAHDLQTRGGRGELDREVLVGQVARNICTALVDRVRADPDGWAIVRDTIVG